MSRVMMMPKPETSWNVLVSELAHYDWMAKLSDSDMELEWLKCQASPLYFLDQYAQIYDKVSKKWIPFSLWTAQAYALKLMIHYRLVNGLKARQEGFSWLAIGYHGLYKCLFHSISTVGFFSKRDDEAQHLLSEERLKGMYDRLPPFLQCQSVKKSDGHHFNLSNGSTVQAFPTTAGDSYSLTDGVLDEFDLVPDQNALLGAVLPAVGETGEITMISRVDKNRPHTPFKRTYENAGVQIVGQRGENGDLVFHKHVHADGTQWAAIFLPWFAHPGRDEDWYKTTSHEIHKRTGALDELYEQYPATPEEALQAKTLDKRIPPEWLAQCYEKMTPLNPPSRGEDWPAIPGLEVFKPPEPGKKYGVGLDPAEGLPSSDDSAIEVLDRETGEEVCALAGKFVPALAAYYADELARWYNNAPILVERNNHGHACLLWFSEHSKLKILLGFDRRPGWNDNSMGKSLLYSNGAELFREQKTTVHSEQTKTQIGSIEASTLRAPPGDHDDRSVAYMLAGQICKRRRKKKTAKSYEG